MKERILFICTFLTASVLFGKEFLQEAEAQVDDVRFLEQFEDSSFVNEKEKNLELKKNEEKLSVIDEEKERK